jgi:hypothetical protein
MEEMDEATRHWNEAENARMAHLGGGDDPWNENEAPNVKKRCSNYLPSFFPAFPYPTTL